MNSKLLKRSLFFLFIGSLFACGFYACKGNKLIASTYKEQPITTKKQLPLLIRVHDTIIVKTPISQDRINKVYGDLFDRYFAPKFEVLIKANAVQAKSIQDLTAILISTRTRSIQKSDSMALVNSRQGAELLKIQNGIDKKELRQVQQNTEQIATTNKAIDVLLIGWGVIVGLFLIMFVFAYMQWRRLNKLYKIVTHDR